MRGSDILTLLSSISRNLDSIWLWKRFSSHLGNGAQGKASCVPLNTVSAGPPGKPGPGLRQAGSRESLPCPSVVPAVTQSPSSGTLTDSGHLASRPLLRPKRIQSIWGRGSRTHISLIKDTPLKDTCPRACMFFINSPLAKSPGVPPTATFHWPEVVPENVWWKWLPRTPGWNLSISAVPPITTSKCRDGLVHYAWTFVLVRGQVAGWLAGWTSGCSQGPSWPLPLW